MIEQWGNHAPRDQGERLGRHRRVQHGLAVAPVGCSFLSWIERLDMSPATATDPLMSFVLVGRALDDVSVWRVDHEAAVHELLLAGPHLRPLAVAILSQPEAAWWFEPLSRVAQLVAMNPAETMERMPPVVLDMPPNEQERYAQAPAWGLYTSTEIDGFSSYLVIASECVGDLGPLITSADARVFEVDGPAAWRQLCVTCPASGPGGLQADLVVPDVAAVERDWDAVHLTLGGLLIADQVVVSGPEGRTAIQSWNAERTVWLRWMSEVTRLHDLRERIQVPAELR